MYRVLYLTGAPATGKTSVTDALREHVSPLEIFEYGERLTDYIAGRRRRGLTQPHLRAQSADMVTHKDVAALDRILVSFVAKNRRKAHIVVDSHAVTKERDGYRVTAFSFKGFASLRPDAIAVLYTSPSVGAKRVKKAKAGRRMVTNWQAEFHTNLQASLAITYGASLGIPVYFIDGEPPLSEVVQCVARLFQTAP